MDIDEMWLVMMRKCNNDAFLERFVFLRLFLRYKPDISNMMMMNSEPRVIMVPMADSASENRWIISSSALYVRLISLNRVFFGNGELHLLVPLNIPMRARQVSLFTPMLDGVY